MPKLRRQGRYAKKPPLAPKRKRRVPVVMYLDDDWDARMLEMD
jgi:hypothetical protein